MTTTAMLIVIALCLIGLGLLLINLHLTNKVQRLEKELRSMKDDRIIENEGRLSDQIAGRCAVDRVGDRRFEAEFTGDERRIQAE